MKYGDYSTITSKQFFFLRKKKKTWDLLTLFPEGYNFLIRIKLIISIIPTTDMSI